MPGELFRRLRRPALLLIVLVAPFLGAIGCAPEAKTPGADQILETEDVGGAIDAELSTEDDPRGRRAAESGRVLPPGFPIELPLPVGATVITHGASKAGGGFAVLRTSMPPDRMAASWRLLLEADGWRVESSGELSLAATREAVSDKPFYADPAGGGFFMGWNTHCFDLIFHL